MPKSATRKSDAINVKDRVTISPADAARIAYQMQLFKLDPKTQFKGTLVVPANKPLTLEHETKTTGTHALVSPDNLRHAKLAVGIPDSAYLGAIPHNRFQSLRMVSAEKKTRSLTNDEVTNLHHVARSYIFSNSSFYSHFEAAIDRHIITRLKAVVYVYTQVDLYSDIQLIGNGQSIVLIVHKLNIHPGGSITTDNSAFRLFATEINYINDTDANNSSSTGYDLVINRGIDINGKDGTNGSNGADQPKAEDDHSGYHSNCRETYYSNSPAHPGTAGGNGMPGFHGTPGDSVPETVLFVKRLNCNVLVKANGGCGGKGGNGGNGGKGGDGGNGYTSPNATPGGNGGNGGNGGMGGIGGKGGDGGVVTLYLDEQTQKVFHGEVSGGLGGHGGTGGTFGKCGKGGTGSPAGKDGTNGHVGIDGSNGLKGTDGQVIIKQSAVPSIDSITPSSAPVFGGAKVNIVGSNFFTNNAGESIMEFKINNKPLTGVTILSPTQASGIVPANDADKPYAVVVTNKETMASAASSQYFTYM